MPKTRAAYPPAFRQQMIKLVQAGRSTCRRTLTSSRFASTAASIRSTPFARCSASPAMSLRPPTPSFTPRNLDLLYPVGLGANRISML